MKDVVFWALFIVMIVGVIGLVRGLWKPSTLSKNNNIPRRKSLAAVLAGFAVVSLSLMSAVVPVGLKQAMLDQQAATTLDAPHQSNQQEIKIVEEKTADTVEAKTETNIEVIPFEYATQNDASLASGTTQVATSGSHGERSVTYKVTYTNGIETAREQTASKVTKQPVTQLTKIGTKTAIPKSSSCISGYYLNSAGNCVHSPGSNPSGASAKCRDGSYSYSQSRRGTCSRHGGVAQWL